MTNVQRERAYFRVKLLGAAAALAIVSGGGTAQAQSTQPGGTLRDQFERRDLPTSQPLPTFRIERPQTGENPDAVRFNVRRVVVDGVASIDPAEVNALASQLDGQTVSFGELAALADRITGLYARAGYAFSFALVPEQTVEDGVVRLRVVEGSLDAVVVEFQGATPVAGRARIEAAIQRRLAVLIAQGPVRGRAFERSLLGLSDLHGFDVSAVVRPSATTEGAATLLVVVTGKPLEAALGVDNRLRAEFGREEIYASAATGSLLIVGDRLELNSRRAFAGDAFVYAGIAYESPVGDGLTRAFARYARASTEARSGLLGLLDYRGREDVFAIGARHALLRARDHSLFAGLTLAGVDTRSSLFGVTVVDEQIRTLAAEISYDWVDPTGARSLATLTLVRGLEGLGASGVGNPLRSRAFGRPDTTHATFRYYRDQPLPAGLRLRTDHEIQFLLSSRPLLAASECTYGGPAIGRAYDAGVIAGDECWRGAAELARPILASAAGDVVEPYLFVDAGYARQQGALEFGERRDSHAVSLGAGFRLFSRFGLNADLQLSQRATRLFPGDTRSPRVFFTLSYQR